MNTSTASLSQMVSSSIAVLSRPSIATFEQHERRGTLQNALMYLAVAGVVGAVVGFLGGLLPGAPTAIGAAIGGFLNVFIGFLLFTGTTYYVGKSQGGTGTFDEVAFTFSLFWVPLSILAAIPVIGWCLSPIALVVAVYFAYLAIHSSMNLNDSAKVIITLGAAALVTIIGSTVIGIIT